MEIGIIGFGQLGQFIAKHLKKHFKTAAADKFDKSEEAKALGTDFVSISDAASKEVVILAVPINQFEGTLKQIIPNLKPGALLLDVCSVKMKPAEIMQAIVPKNVDVIATHPLFGPQSGAKGIKGLKIVICPIRTTKLEKLKKFLEEKLELKVLVKTPEEHDGQMATAACLSHFIGRTLIKLGINEQEIDEPSFRKLLELKKMLEEDSFELFKDIQQNNPFAKGVRDKFVSWANELNIQLDSEKR